MIGDIVNWEGPVKFRLPYHLICDKDLFDVIDEIKKLTNPKLRANFMINRCVKFTKYIVLHSRTDLDFKKHLCKMLGTNDFRKFFFRGGL